MTLEEQLREIQRKVGNVEAEELFLEAKRKKVQDQALRGAAMKQLGMPRARTRGSEAK